MSTTTTRRRDLAPFLDDAVAFAHELYSDLAADGEPRILDTTGRAYQDYRVALHAVESPPPDAPVSPAQVAALDVAAGDWASACHAAGVEFGVAAETLRRSLLASAAGPRIPGQPA